jgi:sugar transferase (PEP-CTERM system associated)
MLRLFSHYVSIKSTLLVVVEGVVIMLSLLCAAKLRFWNRPDELASYMVFPDFAVQLAVVVVVCLVCFYCNDLYNLNPGYTSFEGILRVEQALGAAVLLLGLFYFLFPGLLLSRGVFMIGMTLAAGFLILGRKLLDSAWQHTAPVQRVAILGTGPLAFDVARELTNRADLNMKLEGFVSPLSSMGAQTPVFGFPVLGATPDIEALADHCHLSRIIVALEDRRGALPTRELVSLRVRGLRVDDAATALSALTGRISLGAVRPSWFVFSEGFHRSRWNEVLKRTVDLACGICGLVVSLPVMILVGLLVRLDSRGPVFYRQVRVGRRNRQFDLLKFRSMKVDAEKENGAQWAIQNDPRITRIGRLLRKYRLDELPQFLNVIRGEMSFVGPRPERPCFVDQLRQQIPYYDERHSVRPGITGWAQVSYEYGSTVEDAAHKLEYDLFYLKNMSLAFDLVIIFQTIRIVIKGLGGR